MNHETLKKKLDGALSNYAISAQDLIYEGDVEPETDNEHRLLYLIDDLCRYQFYALSEYRDIIVELEKNRR